MNFLLSLAFHREDQLLSHMNIHLQSYSIANSDGDYTLGEQQYDHTKAETFVSILVLKAQIVVFESSQEVCRYSS